MDTQREISKIVCENKALELFQKKQIMNKKNF